MFAISPKFVYECICLQISDFSDINHCLVFLFKNSSESELSIFSGKGHFSEAQSIELVFVSGHEQCPQNQ
jgi:hypothetical protein